MTTQTQQPSSVSYTNDDESWKTYEEAVEYYYNNYVTIKLLKYA